LGHPLTARLLAGLLLAGLLVTTGCQSETQQPAAERHVTERTAPAPDPAPSAAPGQSESTAAVETSEPLAVEPAQATAVVLQPPIPAFFPDEEADTEVVPPEVVLSAGHQATCLVKIGDTFPNLELTSLAGSPVTLESQLGARLTIVVFWSAKQPMSVEQIQHLQSEFAAKYQQVGVAVVAINVGDSASDVQQLTGTLNADFVNLLDTEGSAFAQVATGLLPRTYLLRPDRSVVWFDLEYSRSTRRELKNALLYVLKQFEQQAHSGGSPLM
jgi:peroxiredoxin